MSQNGSGYCPYCKKQVMTVPSNSQGYVYHYEKNVLSSHQGAKGLCPGSGCYPK